MSGQTALEQLSDDADVLLTRAQLQYLHAESGAVSAPADRTEFLRHVQGNGGWRASVTWSDDVVERAIKTAIREIKKNGVSTRIFDVNVCGASPVYRELLGGKLAAMMLFSEDVQEVYHARYSDEESEIASSMAGRPIRKCAPICALTTTSLYGVGSSQYNRVRHEGRSWQQIGMTEGFGTVHMSRRTIEAVRGIAIATHRMRNVNNQFGEGTSPLMRQLREGLTVLGFEANDVLQHSNHRIAYMLEMYDGAYDDLCLDQDRRRVGPTSDVVATSWIDRWLRMRVQNDEILDRVAATTPAAVKAELTVS